MIERGGVGEHRRAADRRVRALRLAVGIEGIEIERHDVRPRSLRTPHALDRRVQAFDGSGLAADEAYPVRLFLAWRSGCRDHDRTLADQADVAVQTKAQNRIGGFDVG